ncbi:MAG TPA: cytochrome b N-terminal domain-containing protein [Ideonella sp.]|nr:cytochrome b N-terminal domain-containing protein [Ideonella sp.]
MIRLLQALLRAAFMHAEALFNRAFGNRINPLYQLGAITFFLFWIVAASGLYLYAFFETGVADAHDSVQALTQHQWWAGGILRSVHRYASDAMVLTMLLHLARHFAFDRFRGWRWFSWVTGVALIWLVYISGVNGYMLPWDRLAQFVVVASFEWLDWLPMFGGTLMRNFIEASKVNDRLFSLLSFLHIGVPLAVLLLMWVHVQRVPKAATAPAKPVRIGLLVTFLALALVWPVHSQGGAADLAVAPARLALDWFYLIIFPLLYVWPLGAVWAAVGAATALLAALPWLPPKWRREPRRDFHVAVHGPDTAELQIIVRQGETLLDAGLRQGLVLPYECRSGGCGVCVCSVLQGSVDLGPYQPSALPAERRARGEALMCCATPTSDLAIEVEKLGVPAGAPRRHVGRIVAMDRLAPDVMRLVIELPAGEHIDFTAGQYLNVVLDDGQRRAFSFANAPGEPIELHVRRMPGGRFTGFVFESMQVGDVFVFEAPMGGFTLRESTRPIVFVAGATGFAPVKSIIEDAFRRGVQRPMWLYWGVRRRADLYMAELAERWAREHANFHFVPVLSEPAPEDDWHGRTGLVHEALLADFDRLGEHEVYVCGSARMVDAAVPAFIASGLPEGACFSDAFGAAARVPAAARVA